MWGDPQTAASLGHPSSPSSSSQSASEQHLTSLRAALQTLTGPAHVPLSDGRWSDLFLRYDVLVHLDRFHGDDDGDDGGDVHGAENETVQRGEAAYSSSAGREGGPGQQAAVHQQDGAMSPSSSPSSSSSSSVVTRACHSMSRHCRTSSNLAALALHVARMLRDLNLGVMNSADGGGTGTASARSTAGATGGQGHGTGGTGGTGLGGGGATKPSTLAAAIDYESEQRRRTTQRIELVGRARATCGALNLLRILCHSVIVEACRYCGQSQSTKSSSLVTGGGSGGSGGSGAMSASKFLSEAFTYRSRGSQTSISSGRSTGSGIGGGGSGGGSSGDRDAALEIIDAIFTFVSTVGGGGGGAPYNGSGNNARNDNATSIGGSGGGASALLTSIPEIYDATTQALSLLVVLTSTQLYGPMVSSWQCWDAMQDGLNEAGGYRDDVEDGMAAAAAAAGAGGGGGGGNDHYFMRRIMEEAYKHEAEEHATDCAQGRRKSPWTARSVLASLLNLQINRPRPPPRSIAAHHAELADLVARHARGEKVGPDGMYESHAIVMARSPRLDGKGRPIGSEDGGHLPLHVMGGGGGSSGGGEGGDSSSSALAVKSGSEDPDYVPRTDADGAPSAVHYAAALRRGPTRVFVDATRGVLHVSSTLLLLPFRLMSLALALFGAGGRHGAHRLIGHGGGATSLAGGASTGEGGYDHARMVQLEAAFSVASLGKKRKKLTNDVLWLTDSPVADLGTALFLVLVNNYRASASAGATTGAGADGLPPNPFRAELASLNDNRWEGHESVAGMSLDASGGADMLAFGNGSQQLGGFGGLGSPMGGGLGQQPHHHRMALSTNFESLFESFGRTLHTESSQLFLYTLLQSSPTFAASVAVRSDLDTLVMPLLRTLYFASTMTHQQKTGAASSATDGKAGSESQQQQHKPHFRSQSQLYVILILLLIFSQDLSFGPDVFRRVMVARVPWYRERHIRDVNLGSVLLLTTLRAITFNLHRLKDPFLLSNCCAVLLNVSPHVSGLHSYAAMRLASVTVSCMKKYTVLVGKNGGKPAEEGDVMSVLGMYGETCRTLLQVVKHSIRARVVGKNLHFIYALVYLQRDFYDIMSARASPFKTPEVGVIMSIISQADKAIQEDGTARTAEQTMDILERSVDKLKAVTKPPAPSPGPGALRDRSDSFDSLSSDISNVTDAGNDFTFTYEEEADPEIFFVPYLWEVIVCVLTASSLEWDKANIKVFPLLDDAVEEDEPLPPALQNYASDAGDAV